MSFLIEYDFQEAITNVKGKNAVQLNSRCLLVSKEDQKGKKTFQANTLDGSIIYFGDLISDPFKETVNEFVHWLNSAKGNFNGVYYSEKFILIFSSMFSVLPTFYTQAGNSIYVSDQIKNLLPSTEHNSIDDFHFLERILFNYSLTDRTCISGIKQIPVNSFLKLNGNGSEFYKHTEISNLFQDDPIPFKNCIRNLVDLFNVQLAEYLPNSLFNAALTSGFDGRSIVSSCIKNKKEFIAYSFGTKESDDVDIPLAISRKTGIDYRPILIDDKYLSEIYFDSAKQIVIESNGLSTIGRAHYHYGSEILSNRSGIMVSGNCGSELLRASHLDGVLTTSVFFYWLQSGLPNTLTDFVKLFPAYSFLDQDRFSGVYEKLVVELETKRKKNSDLPLNARLYYLMWEESLRNYFGAELCMQQKHLIHRSPFLDYTFFKEIQGTMASGAYFNYRDKNPIRRMQGQLFYANFIKENDQDLFKLPTGRGYSPSDILSVKGKIKLIYSKFLKSKHGSDRNIDPLFSTKGFKTYYNEFVNNLTEKLKDYIDTDQNIDENSMKTVISFSIFSDHLDSERILFNKN